MFLVLAGLGAIAIVVLPGLAVLAAVAPALRLSPPERLCLAGAVGLCVYPLMLLWLSVGGVQGGPGLVWCVTALSVVVTARSWRRPACSTVGLRWSVVLLVPAVSAIALTRWTAVKGMVAPAWGDAVHHTMIVQLLLDHGGLFQSWAPYAPIESLTYHFGFHANVVAWAWVSSNTAVNATLVMGQVINVLAVVGVYPLAVRLSGTRWAGLVAVIIAGLVLQLPAGYVNWGRYTHLTALAILPGLLWCFDAWCTGRASGRRRLVPLVAVLASGVFLSHYRLALVSGAAGIAWALWLMWRRRHRLPLAYRTIGAMAVAALLAAVALAPWLAHLASGRYLDVMLAIDPSAQATYDWRDLNNWHLVAPMTAMLAAAAAIAAAWYRPRLGGPVLLWSCVAFVVTNPLLLGLPGTGWVMNDMLIYSLYVPMSLCCGWVGGRVASVLWFTGRRPAVLTITAAALLAGAVKQQSVVDPFFQMVTAEDQVAFAWIAAHTPPTATFLVNGFVRDDGFVVGSDAGWWLALFTRRAASVPPALYHTERVGASVSARVRELVTTLESVSPRDLGAALTERGISHVFIGERRGSVGFGIRELLPESLLRASGALTLEFQSGRAQVWRVRPDAAHASAGSRQR